MKSNYNFNEFEHDDYGEIELQLNLLVFLKCNTQVQATQSSTFAVCCKGHVQPLVCCNSSLSHQSVEKF